MLLHHKKVQSSEKGQNGNPCSSYSHNEKYCQNAKKISFCFSFVVTIACNAFNKNVTSLLASYGPIIRAELFQGKRKCIDHTAANCDDHRTV